MAESGYQTRLLPSLLDRLTDDRTDGPPVARGWSQRQARQAVLRDLGWLLNAHCRPPDDNLDEFPEVSTSVLNYGMPDLCGQTASGLSADRLERMLTQAVQRFEPRIIPHTLTVDVIDPGGAARGNSVVLEIKGQVWASPMPDSLYLRTEVDLESGECRVQDKQHG